MEQNRIEETIRKKRAELEKLEDEYHRSRQKLDAEYDRLDSRKQQFENMIETKYEVGIHYLRQSDEDISDQCHQLQSILEDYLFMGDTCFHEERRSIENKEKQLEQEYKKEYCRQEEELEEMRRLAQSRGEE